METVTRLYFLGIQYHCRWWLQLWNQNTFALWKESYHQLKQHIKKQRHYFAGKGLSSQSNVFFSSHLWMWELDYKESWAPKSTFELWCWRRLLRTPWTARRSNQSILKEISPGCSLEGLMLKPKLQYFGHLMRRAGWPIWKDSDAGEDWRQEKGMTEDEIVGWYYWLNGHEF